MGSTFQFLRFLVTHVTVITTKHLAASGQVGLPVELVFFLIWEWEGRRILWWRIFLAHMNYKAASVCSLVFFFPCQDLG